MCGLSFVDLLVAHLTRQLAAEGHLNMQDLIKKHKSVRKRPQTTQQGPETDL